MLEIKGAVLSLGGDRRLSGLSFVVPDGKLTALYGAAHTGKSAVIGALMCFGPLDAGYVTLDGEPVAPATAGYFRSRMAYVPQHCSAPGPISVAQLFELLMKSRDGKYAIPSPDEAMAAWSGLQIDKSLWTACLDDVPEVMRRRVLLSFVACMKRRVLIADEPDTGQPDDVIEAMMSLLRSAASSGAAVLISTRDRRVAERCDGIVEL